MYKVFFVDDEAAMRAGIRKNMNWDTSGFTLVGEASDGEMALPLLRDVMPDILITDIKMPFMDGIELARRTKQAMPWIKIIILSGHDEFEYARQAITIGAEEYMLKPVTSVELFKALTRVASKIEAEKERQRIERDRILNIKDVSINELIPVAKGNQTPIIDSLRYASKQDIPQLLENYLSQFDQPAIQSVIFLHYMFMDFLTVASKVVEEQKGDPRLILSEYSDVSALMDVISDIDNAKKVLSSIIEKVIDFRDTVTGSKYSEVIRKAQEYIHNNYKEQNISLNSVAKAVNVSPNHFSTIFSQETGETLINYVTRVKLEQAKILLKTTNMRTVDIANEVGYNDTHYFSYVFKKNIGMTPKEFRCS